jgi:hypothetical protein
LQAIADVVDPEYERCEPGQDHGIGGYVFSADIELSAKEANEDDNGKGKEGKDRFHVISFVLFRLMVSVGLLYGGDDVKEIVGFDPEDHRADGANNQQVGDKQLSTEVEVGTEDVSEYDSEKSQQRE